MQMTKQTCKISNSNNNKDQENEKENENRMALVSCLSHTVSLLELIFVGKLDADG